MKFSLRLDWKGKKVFYICIFFRSDKSSYTNGDFEEIQDLILDMAYDIYYILFGTCSWWSLFAEIPLMVPVIAR